jgi:hypothetical protein
MDDPLRRRLVAQQLVRPRFGTAHELVRWFGAVQAQDYLGSLWAVGQRLTAAREADVERSLAERRMVRTWPMRGTLHFVAAEDVRWMVALLAPRVLRSAGARFRQLELTARDLARCGRVMERVLAGGGLTRPELYVELDRAGLSPAGQRGFHMLGFQAQQGLVCLGPRRGRQPLVVLVDEWLPPAPGLAGDDALRELARLYFRSHGPATAQDFAWWAGLTKKEVAVAMEGLPAPPPARAVRPFAALLPAWDEYLVAYKDRSAAMGHLPAARRAGPMATGKATIVVDGRVLGTWSRRLEPRRVRLAFDWWVRPSATDRRLVEEAVARYAAFLGLEPSR